MLQLPTKSPEEPETLEAVRDLLERYIARNELLIPSLPTVAVRVVRSGTKNSCNAHVLADIIHTDAALTDYVLRIASSAAKGPSMPITSLQHAIAWLGLDDVANIAFTLALQGKMLHVEGQHRKARRLWRHSLASALWARQLAHTLARETGLCYLGGLLHNIGRVVALGAVHEVAQRARHALAGNEYDCLIDVFSRDVGRRVISAWALPPPVPAVVERWDCYASAGALRWECTVVNVAHKLADFTLHEPSMLTRELLVLDPAYRDLGFCAQDAGPLFDSTAAINAELDRYLSP
ncbi:MAG TPA: HDOD domain-containing protein [Steroidobacteraceae bacterium]|jgi:HD-like signal output (HDOD) protein|nr:HDOD domain-containing protein [Steroidobacteraceae bacterium]